MSDVDFFFNHEKYVTPKTCNVSICKSNIKKEDNLYYARVCNKGHVNLDSLLSILQEKSFQVDPDLMKANTIKLIEIIVDLVSEGNSVELPGLGTFSLKSVGKIELKKGMQRYVDGGVPLNRYCNDSELGVVNSESNKDEYIENKNTDFDISDVIKTRPKFQVKFTPSQYCKKKCEDVKMAFAFKKKCSPVIRQIEDITPKQLASVASMIKVSGENLKVLGEKGEVGIYIKEENGDAIKIEKENIIHNTPKKLIILYDRSLKDTEHLNLSIITQYVKMGSKCTTSILRGDSTKVKWKAIGDPAKLKKTD